MHPRALELHDKLVKVGQLHAAIRIAKQVMLEAKTPSSAASLHGLQASLNSLRATFPRPELVISR